MTDKPRTIAFILPNFQAGGAERVMVTIANHLDREKFSPIIIVFDDQGPLRDLVVQDVAVVNLGVARVRHGIWPLVRAVRETKADVVVSTMAHLNMIVLIAKCFLPRVPVIVREAVTPSYFSGNFVKRTILTLAYYFLYPLADRILSPTQMVFDEMPSFYRRWPGKQQRIFNPVNISLIGDNSDAGLRSRLANEKQRLFVGAGRLVDQKGFDRLIEALRRFKDKDDWRLVILGDGPDQQKLKNMIDDYGLSQITLAGFESKPWRYFAVADAFVLPSRHEGLPNVALEALALGVPVIAACSAGGIGEIAEASSGHVSLAQNMDDFVGYMDMVTPYRGPLPRPSLLPECFSLPHVVASYEKILADVLSKKS